jgi:hypothetical protein
MKIVSFSSQSLDNYFMYGGDAFGQGVVTHVAIRIGMDGCIGLQGTPADQAQAEKGWALAFGDHGEHVSLSLVKKDNNLIIYSKKTQNFEFKVII